MDQKLDPTIEHTTGKWKAEEDTTLTDAEKEHSYGNRVTVAALVPGRTYNQCCKRWVMSLDPDINKGKWKPEEEVTLTEAVTKCANNMIWLLYVVLNYTSTTT
jgi:hypothetical protein